MPKRTSSLLPSVTHLEINNCLGVELSDKCLPSKLKETSLLNCSKLCCLTKGGLGKQPFHKILVHSKSLLPQLLIYDCPNLKKLDYKVSVTSPLSSANVYSILSCTPMFFKGGSTQIHFKTQHWWLPFASLAMQETRRRRLEQDCSH